jgi:acetyl/propionyl-CoA carboxylase alpha subunit
MVARGESREQAIGRAVAALRQFVVLGIQTNVPLLLRVLHHPRFLAGEVDTRFLDAELPALFPRDATHDERLLPAASAAAAWYAAGPRTNGVGAGTRGQVANAATNATAPDPWESLGWRA